MQRLTATTSDGAAIAVTIRGAGRPLLLVTGLGGNARFWTVPASELARSRLVITFDHRAIADSTRGSAAVDITRLADDCAVVLDAVGIARTDFLGHSMGGVIGQSFSARMPERLGSLVLSGTWHRPNRFMDTLFKARLKLLMADPVGYAAIGSIMGHPPDWLDANWSTLELALEGAPVSATQQAHVAERIAALLAFDGAALAGAYQGPTLVQGARDDMIVPAYLQDALKAAIPHASQRIFADGGHLFPVTRAEDFVSSLDDWLTRNGDPI
jgi:aminoacrylate hydrolase